MSSKKEQQISLKIKAKAGPKLSRHAMEEFGPGKSGFVFCPHGEAVYYKKSWHHAAKFFTNPPKLSGKGIRFKPCPVHEMLKNKQYEGELVIKNVPAKFRRELLNLIENFGKRAIRKDVLDRILEFRIKNQEFRITTSENQLAQKLANKISEVFKKRVGTETSRAAGKDVVRIKISF